MIKGLLDNVTRLRNNAQDLRSKGREEPDPGRRAAHFAAAAEEIGKAITTLQRGLRTVRSTQEGYTQDVCRLLEALSQSCGSLGGIHRDAGKLDLAKKFYDSGNEYEEERRLKCGAKDTYNMLQRLIIRLLIEPTLIEEAGFIDELDGVRQEIDRQRAAGRDDSWALADLALVRILIGTDADTAFGDLEKIQAGRNFYESTYNAIAALQREGFGRGRPWGERLEAFKLLLQRKGGLA